MISLDDFKKKYPDRKALEKDFPIGTEFLWSDREKHTIVGYLTDHKTDLIIFKLWLKHKKQWCYDVCNTFVFYSVWDYDTKRAIETLEKYDKEIS